MPGVGAGPPPPLPSGEPVPAAGPGPPHHAGPAHDPAAPPGDDRSVHRCSPLPMAFHTVAVKHPCTASTRVCIGSETAPCVTVLVHCHQELVVDSVELILEDTGRARCLAEELKGCDGTDEGKERMADGKKSTSNMFILREWRQEAAGFMGNMVVLTVHLFILALFFCLWGKETEGRGGVNSELQ